MDCWGVEKGPHPGITPAEVRRENDFQFSFAFDNSETPIETSLLGNKGVGLVEMTRLNLPVPPGFILTTEAWRDFSEKNSLPENVWQETLRQLDQLEKKTGLKFGDPEIPLVVSVRSGAPQSMPGLLTTILNVGLNDETVQGLAKRVGDWCAMDSYRRGIESFGKSVYGINPKEFAAFLTAFREEYKVSTLPVEGFTYLIPLYRSLYREHGADFPQDPYEQLRLAITGVFQSSNNPIVSLYREHRNIPGEGTAVIIQEMVYGNSTKRTAGAGVYFTRDPQTGEPRPRVAFLKGIQGTDVVGPDSSHPLLPTEKLPKVFRRKLVGIGQVLEEHYGDPQEVEFAYDGGDLWVLQTRKAHLTPEATLHTLYDLSEKGVLSRVEIIDRFTQELGFLFVTLDPEKAKKAKKEGRFLGQGVPISSGAAVGVVVADLVEAKKLASRGISTIFVREDLSEQDLVELSENVTGIITRLGGGGSHIAQILRGTGDTFGLPAIFGFEVSKIKLGTEISFDASEGEVFVGRIPIIRKKIQPRKVATFFERYQNLLRANPWLIASYQVEQRYHWDALRQQVEAAVGRVQKKWQSPKAQIVGLIAELIPPQERMEYLIFPKDEIGEIRETLYNFLKDDRSETSVRTCHTPPKLAIAPWQRIVTPQEIDPFLENRDFPGKYGGYSRWREDETLTEVVVGRFPKGKLDPALAWEHCVFTIFCLEKMVILQIIPHTAQLRDFESVDPNKLITVRAIINPGASTRLGRIITHFGGNIEKEPESQRFAEAVTQTVVKKWWEPPFALPHRLAALTEGAKLNILEGQARIYPNGHSWCLIYGMKGEEKPLRV